MRHSLVCLFAALGAAASLPGQTTVWNNPSNDSYWATPGNWSAGVPTPTSAVSISAQPTDDTIDINTGNPTTIASLTFDATLTAPIEVVADGVETLQVNGSITNNAATRQTFSLLVFAGANGTYAGGTGGLEFNVLSVGGNSVATSGSVTIDTTLNFTLNSVTSYGQIGLANVSGATININVTDYSASWGDTFDFAPDASSDAFTGANFDPNSLPALSGGLYWDTSKFLSEGILTVVPEPSTWVLLGLAAGLLTILTARHRRAALTRIRR